MAHILLIEDQKDFREMLHTCQQNHGHTVIEASEGGEALEAYKKAKFDLVITDLVMPGKEGIETIGALRKLKDGVRILAMSGGGKTELTNNYLRLAKLMGAIATLEKPFTMEAFLASVTSALP